MYISTQIKDTKFLGTCRIPVDYYENFQLIARQVKLINETFPSRKFY